MARRKKTEKRELSHEDIPRNTRATAGIGRVKIFSHFSLQALA